VGLIPNVLIELLGIGGRNPFDSSILLVAVRKFVFGGVGNGGGCFGELPEEPFGEVVVVTVACSFSNGDPTSAATADRFCTCCLPFGCVNTLKVDRVIEGD
jgi:hypothetical protein